MGAIGWILAFLLFAIIMVVIISAISIATVLLCMVLFAVFVGIPATAIALLIKHIRKSKE